jgi:membrane-associated phospholipid phosphatase
MALRRRLRQAAPAAVACIASSFVFLALATRVPARGGLGPDAELARAVDRLGGLVPRGVDPDVLLARALTAGAAFLVGAVLIFLAGKKRYGAVVFVLVSVGGAAVLERVCKQSFKRPPVDPNDHGYSFPSGTAAVSAAAVLALVLVARSLRARLIIAALGACVVSVYGALVVYARWHFASDVVAGWALAFAWVAAVSVVVCATRARRPEDESAAKELLPTAGTSP